MYPLFHIGPVELPTYGSIILVAYIIGVLLMIHHGKIYNFDKMDFFIVSILSLIGLIVGAKLFSAISTIPEIVKFWNYYSKDIPYMIYFMLSGFVFYGGLIGALFMIFLYCRQTGISFLKFTNVIAPVIPFIHSLGRIGCFFGGCCYGIEYYGPFSIQFPHNEFVPGLNVCERFPIQLLEALINMVIFIILYAVSAKPRKPGLMLGIYLITYSITRFSLEFLRGDVERGFFFNVSTSQWISLFLIPLGLYLICRRDVATD